MFWAHVWLAAQLLELGLTEGSSPLFHNEKKKTSVMMIQILYLLG